LTIRILNHDQKPGVLRNALRWDVLLKDLSLLASLWMAWLIVWKALRRERKGRLARPQKIHLVPKAVQDDH
jgi:hypothetical protein